MEFIEICGTKWGIIQGGKAWVIWHGRKTFYGKTRDEAIPKAEKRGWNA